MPLILASASPRRQELLKNAGISFRLCPVKIDEARRSGESGIEYVRRMASEKALSAGGRAPRQWLVLGADTVVESDGQILGKPLDRADAIRMLRLLSGTTHFVLTGFCLVRAPNSVELAQHESTQVEFRPLDDEEIMSYVASGEPFDKAGAYGIQGLASKFVRKVNGCFFNVVGLPVSAVYEALKSLEGRK